MAIAPFNISEGRVLIITPQLTVKDTVLESFDSSSHENFWSKYNIVSPEAPLPSVIEYSNDLPNDVLFESEIVILNIHKLQERLDSSLIHKVSPGFFDMIIIDEAHHSPAETWTNTLAYFENAKVIKLTATPFRSDGQEISGEIIYEYKLSQAMGNKYVKSLVCNEFLPGEVTFTLKGSAKEYSYSQILEIKDADWVSRSVAYSTKCSEQVAEASIELLKEKRITGIPHMIIAVACSIRHAEEIADIYSRFAFKTEVIHSELERDQIEQIKTDIKNHRIDVIVNVGMLGEGYDHKYLSIAAIFRPYRSSLPYQQFVGRILRYIPEAKYPSDNLGHIISHKHLFLEDLWEEYRLEVRKAEIISGLNEVNLRDYMSENGTPHSYDIGSVNSTNGELSEEYFLMTDIIQLQIEETNAREKAAQALVDTLGIDIRDAREKVKSIRPKEDTQKITRLDLHYKSTRKDLNKYIQEIIVPNLVVKHDLKEGDLRQLPLFQRQYNWILTKTADPEVALIIYFNAYLKKEIGDGRDDWNLSDFEKADSLLEEQKNFIDSILETYLQ